MLATTIFFLVVGLLLAIVVGVNLSSNIVEIEMYFMFWLMYIITLATLSNVGLSIYYYFQTRHKAGPRGNRGPRGDPGDPGSSGKCDPNCRNKICSESVLEQMTQQIRQLSGDARFQSSDINNAYIRKTITRICGSPQFQQLAPLKGPAALIDYIKGIWRDITQRLYEEGGQRYFRTVGAEQAFDWQSGNNPWDEFKKYGIYYWGLDKSYRPTIEYMNDKDGTVPRDPFVEMDDIENIDKPKASILGFINADSEGEVYNITKQRRGTYIMEASLAATNITIQQKYDGHTSSRPKEPVPTMTFMVKHPTQPDQCLEINGQVTKWRMCDPYTKQQRFSLEWSDVGKREFRMKAHNSKYLVGSGSKMQVVDGKSVGNIYSFDGKSSK
jgi:hypothetical protein